MYYYNNRPSFFSWMPPVIKNIIIINVIMLIFTYLTGDFMYEKFALFYFKSDWFKPYQFVTHIFMHGGFVHLLFNMYSLVIFGVMLERSWGSGRFLAYYMITGLGAAALHTLVLHFEYLSAINAFNAGNHFAINTISAIMNTPTVGASGAVYGILLAYGMSYPNSELQLLFPPVRMKAKWFVIIFGGIELLLGITDSGSNIAHFAHLGGMIFGYLLIIYWRRRHNIN